MKLIIAWPGFPTDPGSVRNLLHIGTLYTLAYSLFEFSKYSVALTSPSVKKDLGKMRVTISFKHLYCQDDSATQSIVK